MIKLSNSSVVDRFISPEVFHPNFTGSNNTQVTVVHNRGRAPDRVFCQAKGPSDSIFKNAYTVWLEGSNYRGWYVGGNGDGADLNTIKFVAHSLHVYGISGCNIRFVLEWD